jgi:hypothetical protein
LCASIAGRFRQAGIRKLEKRAEKINFVQTKTENMDKEKFKKYFKRLGLAGFLFFFIKGLIWLAIFFGGAKLFNRIFE